ncbi:hypothetical protein IAQ61_007130 [Plenodomus lingam]|uniref:uncharacterized protein n=1 Tax=Leptosphaeria maculans TaxID=5022 RepID=UPI00333082D9|nr:hypothetical protein IAQ61_007130 [Plenodomus lingam]
MLHQCHPPTLGQDGNMEKAAPEIEISTSQTPCAAPLQFPSRPSPRRDWESPNPETNLQPHSHHSGRIVPPWTSPLNAQHWAASFVSYQTGIRYQKAVKITSQAMRRRANVLLQPIFQTLAAACRQEHRSRG